MLPAPNYTQIPNVIIDKWMSVLSGLELKVLLFITRKIVGWHKVRDRISITQIEKSLGASRGKICEAIKSLESHGLIVKIVEGENGSQKTYYELNITEEIIKLDPSQNIPTSAERVPATSTEKVRGTSTQKVPTKETLNTKENNTKKSKAGISNTQACEDMAPEIAANASASACLPASPEILKETIFYKGTNRATRSITRSEIFSYFLRSGYSNDTINKSIEEFQRRVHPTSDPFKLLNLIIKDLSRIQETSNQKEKPKSNAPAHASNYGPRVRPTQAQIDRLNNYTI